jgi:hypothetical protein
VVGTVEIVQRDIATSSEKNAIESGINIEEILLIQDRRNWKWQSTGLNNGFDIRVLDGSIWMVIRVLCITCGDPNQWLRHGQLQEIKKTLKAIETFRVFQNPN